MMLQYGFISNGSNMVKGRQLPGRDIATFCSPYRMIIGEHKLAYLHKRSGSLMVPCLQHTTLDNLHAIMPPYQHPRHKMFNSNLTIRCGNTCSRRDTFRHGPRRCLGGRLGMPLNGPMRIAQQAVGIGHGFTVIRTVAGMRSLQQHGHGAHKGFHIMHHIAEQRPDGRGCVRFPAEKMGKGICCNVATCLSAPF